MAVRMALHRPDRSRPVGPSQESAPARGLERPGVACLVVVFCLYAGLAWRAWEQEASVGPLNWYTSLLWSLPILCSSLGLAGVVRQRRRGRVAAATRESPERVDDLLIVVVPTVARFDSLVALQRVVRSFLRQLPECFSHVRVDVVIEEGCPGSDEVARLAGHPRVRVLTVPRRYSTARGTRFKARANQYAHELRAREGEAKDDVWVLHMDDDTAVGPDTAAALAEFINRQATAGADARHLAQGVLAFPRELAASRVLWLADAVRPGCDLSLFAATTGRGSPRMGLHGELLLVRASVEAEIGWDFGPVAIVEDAQFALEFCARYPGRSDWFSGRSYGAAPANLRDFLRQRERWSWGLFTLVTDPAVPFRRRALLLAMVAVWAAAPLQHPVVPLVLAVVLADTSTGPVSPLIIPFWSLNIAFCVWLYWEGLKVNASASARARRTWWEPAVLVLLLPLFALWEATGVARGLTKFVRGSDTAFTVITKSG